MARTETRKFIGQITASDGMVQKALAETLGKPDAITPFLERVVPGLIDFTVSQEKLRTVLPMWMSQRGLYQVTSEISSAGLWDNLLQGVNDEQQQELVKELHYKPLGETIAVNNARFITTALTLGLAAAACGPKVGECIAPVPHSNPINTDFAIRIGERYPNPPADVEEYMSRVLELIPHPDQSPLDANATLFNELVKSNVFVSSRGGRLIRCPAVRMTKMLFEQWGRQLHTDQVYQAHFRQLITNP